MGFDVQEYRKNRANQEKEVTKQGGGFDVQTYRRQKQAPQVGEDITNRVNTWLKDNEFFINTYKQRNASPSSYRADTADWLSKATSRTKALGSEANDIRAILADYADFYDPKWVNSINSVLDSSTSLYDKILSASTKDHEYWSQWANEEEYKNHSIGWLEDDAEVSEDIIAQRRDRYQSNADRIAEIEAAIDGYEIPSAKNEDETFFEKIGRYLSGASDTTLPTVPVAQSTGKTELQQLKAEMDALKAENRRYEREQKALDDYFVPETEEFLQNAAYREYGNPTKQDIESYAMANGDTAALIAAGADIYDGGWRDKDGNLIEIDFDAKEPVVKDKYAFYMDNLNDTESVHSDYALTFMSDVMLEGKSSSWEYLKKNEANIYYNLLKTEGQEAAYNFLDAMKPTLNKRATQAMAKEVSNAPVLEQIFYNVASIPSNIIGDATAFVDDAVNIVQGKDINPYSQAHRMQNFAQAVRQDTAQDINKATGNVALPYVGTTFGDVYQALMSGADSLVGIGLGGSAYGVLMGMGAASSEAKELYEKGASMGQIVAGGILAGAAEMVFEKVSIDHFVKMGDTKSIKTFIVNTLKQGGIEASEEMLTEISNTLTDAVVMGTQSDLRGYVDQYVSQGYSESEAVVKALFNDVASNVINAGIGGLISGGAMGSIGSTGSYFNYQNRLKSHGQSIIDRGGVDTVKALADDMAGVKAVSKASSKVGSKASAKNVGRLSVAIEEAMSAQNKADIESALVEKGLSKAEANRVADMLTDNKVLTAEQTAEIKSNEKVKAVVKELVEDPKSTLNQRKLNLLAARLGVDMKNSTINANTTKSGDVSLKNDVDVSKKVSKEGKTIKVSTGEAITINKNNAIAKTKVVDGERVVYYNTDHGLVEATDVTYANEEDGLLFEAFSDMNPAFANAAIKNYDGSVPVQKYIDGMREGILLYGMHNFQAVGKDISRNSDLAALSEADQSFALKLGRAYANENAKKADTKLRTAIRNAAEKAKASEDASTTEATQNKPKKGSVRFENGTRAKTVAQKRAVSLAKHLSKAIGIDIVFYDAMTTRDKNGKKANGYFDSKTNSIHLDLQNAVTDSKTIAFTLSHELVHFIKKWSPAKFNTFANFLMEQYAAHGVSTSTLLANKMAALGTTDADYAYEEMIADACERMLLDSNAVVKLMELRKSDLELFEKVKLHILQLLNKIRDAFKGVDPNTEEGIALQKMEDVLGKIHEMFEDAAVDAVQNYQAGQTLDTEAVSVSEDGTIQMQMKQYQQTGRSTLLNYLTSQYGENNANDLISTIDSIYNVMAEIKENTALSVFGNWQDTDVELDAEGHPIFTTSINNGDYVLNQDFSRVCKKRRQLDFVLNMLAEDQAFEASHLTNEDFVKINNAIKSHGFEIACALCFVDSKRFRQAEWADSFANTWNDILGSIVKDDSKLTPFNFATNNPNMSDDGIEIDSSKSVTYRKWSEGKEDVKNRRTYENFEQMFAKGKNGKWLEGNTNVRTIATLLRDHPELRHTFRGADIIASKGFDTIQRLAPEVRSILDGWGGSSVPKPSSNDASYDSSIINSKGYNKENAYAMGGVRMNSFSDFMAHMFFDYCQAFADLSAKELPSQAYTKELTYVRLFGRSGQKINMSGIAAIRDDALPTVAGKGVTKAQAEANEKIEKMVAGLDITRLLEHLNKDIYQLTEADVEQFLDMCDYVWADESINMKHATLLQTGILYDKLSETKIEECYELLKAGKVDQALKAAGEENVDREYAKHCGTIVVGVSDAHIRKLLRDPNVRMVIPYHKSGLNPIIARELKISAYNDYTDVQNTGVIRKGTKSRSNLTNEEIKKAYGLKDFAFYDWFGKTIDGKLYDGKATADKYLEWCEKGYYDENVGDYVYYTSKGDGYILASELHKKLTVEPKFKDFTGEENYYKLLEDFDCYNTITGEHSEQGAVDFLRDGLPTDYKGVLIEALKAEQKVSDDFKEHLDNKGLRDEIINIVKAHGYTPSETSKDDGIKKQVKKDSLGNTLSDEQVEFFKDSKVRDNKGNLLVVYHGTTAHFNIFKKGDIGFHFGTKGAARGRVGFGKNVTIKEVYLNITNPIEFDEDLGSWDADYRLTRELYDKGILTKEEAESVLFSDDKTYRRSTESANKKLSSVLMAKGYDGISYQNTFETKKATTSYIVFNSNQAKEISNLNPTSNPDIRYQKKTTSYAPTFYSQMGKVIDGIKMEKIGTASIVNFLKGKGIKNDEIKWSGIEAFLEGKKSVTKAELQEFVAASMLQIEETIIDNTETPMTKEREDKIASLEGERNTLVRKVKSEWKRVFGTDELDNYAGEALPYDFNLRITNAVVSKKMETSIGQEYKAAQEAMKQICEESDYFGYDNAKQAYVEVLRNPYGFLSGGEYTADEEAAIIRLAEAKEAWLGLKDVVPASDVQSIKDLGEDVERLGHKIYNIRAEHRAEQQLPLWGSYKLKGGENYREMVFKIPGSNYTNEAMETHWRKFGFKGVLAHARIQDFDVDGKKMLFIEEIQSDWHNDGEKRGYIDETKRLTVDNTEMRHEKGWYALYRNGEDLHQAYSEKYLAQRFVNGITDKEIHHGLVDEYNKRVVEHNLGVELVPDAPFRNTYHEYVLKRLLRMAAEEGYDSIGWTTADIQSERWSDEFSEGYRIEYDQDIPKFLRKYGKKWGATVGNTTINGDTEIWSMDITDSMKESVLYEGQPMFQKKTVTNRTLLANALESAAQNDIERNKLAQYKSKIDLIESEQAKLAEVRARANELRFTKGRTPDETKQMKALDFEAIQIANRINTYDRQLLNLESTLALKNVLQREKEQARKREAQKGKEALAAYKEKSAKTQRELMNRYQESRKKGIEGRRKTEMRHKIKDVVNELNQYLLKGTKEKHVPIELQKAVAEALDAVNMDTVGAAERIAKLEAELMKAKTPEDAKAIAKKIEHIQEMGGNFEAKLSRLKTAYDSIINSDDPLIANSHDEVISNSIDKVIEIVGDTPLRDMSLYQLESVYDMYRMVLTTIRNTNKAFKAAKGEEISTIANGVIAELDEKKRKSPHSTKGMQALSEFDWNNLKPVYAFERIGSANFTKVFNAVRSGEDVWARDMSDAQAFREEQFDKYKYDSWDFDKSYGFTSTSGMHFELSLGQIMSLYAYSKRDQAGDHLKYGGFVFDGLTEVKKKTKAGITVTYQLQDATAYNLSEETLAEIVGKLNPEQKAFVDVMQDYLSTTMGEKGNEVSLALYDVKLFKEKNYFPLKSDTHYLAKAREQAQGDVKIKNSGFTKETNPKAKNPIVLTSFMDVWAGHVNEMSMYHAFTLPLEDFYRVYNYNTPANETMRTMSVASTLKDAHTEAAVKYIDQLLKDLNGGARSDPRETLGKSLMSNFKKAAVMASLSVIVQQPTAIVRATALINPKYFAGKKVAKGKHKTMWAEIKKYAPVAVVKEMGYFDTGMGKGSVEWLKGEKTFMDKVDDVVSWAPAYADESTWIAIWNAVKRETLHTHKNLKPNSDEFHKAAGERFTEVITKTQVYDSTLSRSANMRSKSAFMNMVTSFMAEPTTSINMLQDALRKGNKKYIARAFGAVYGSVILNSALVSLIYAMRDDDEDETFLEKYLSRFTTEVVDGINPLTYIPFVKDIWSAAQGFDIERSDMSLITDVLDSFQQLVKVVSKDTDDMDEDELGEHKKSVAEALASVVDNISSLAGVPVKNVRREFKGVINFFSTIGNGRKTTAGSLADVIGSDLKDSIPVWGWFPDESKGDKLYDAIIKGDTAYVDRLKSGYRSDTAYHSAIRSALKENDPRIKEAAAAWHNGNIAEYTRIAKLIIAEKHFSQDDVVAAINAEINAIKKGESQEEETPKDEVTSIYRGSDVNDAFEYGDNALAKSIIDDLIKTKVANGTEEKNARASVKASMTSYWKPLYKAAYKAGNAEEMRRIRTILKESGIYGGIDDIIDTCKAWLRDN